jgi:hypothetical protein
VPSFARQTKAHRASLDIVWGKVKSYVSQFVPQTVCCQQKRSSHGWDKASISSGLQSAYDFSLTTV